MLFHEGGDAFSRAGIDRQGVLLTLPRKEFQADMIRGHLVAEIACGIRK